MTDEGPCGCASWLGPDEVLGPHMTPDLANAFGFGRGLVKAHLVHVRQSDHLTETFRRCACGACNGWNNILFCGFHAVPHRNPPLWLTG